MISCFTNDVLLDFVWAAHAGNRQRCIDLIQTYSLETAAIPPDRLHTSDDLLIDFCDWFSDVLMEEGKVLCVGRKGLRAVEGSNTVRFLNEFALNPKLVFDGYQTPDLLRDLRRELFSHKHFFQHQREPDRRFASELLDVLLQHAVQNKTIMLVV